MFLFSVYADVIYCCHFLFTVPFVTGFGEDCEG